MVVLVSAVGLHLGCGGATAAKDPVPVTVVQVQPVVESQRSEAPDEPAVEPSPVSASAEAGGASFRKHCVHCHGEQGEGRIGPNLTDGCSIHGARMRDIRSVIEGGVPEKGMVAWGSVLGEGELEDITVYVHGLAKTDAPGGKTCQGKKVR